MSFSGMRASLIGFGLLLIFVVGGLVAVLPSFSVTLVVGMAVALYVFIRPRAGILLILILLYFPVFPVVPLGPFEFSVTSPLVLAMFLGALNLRRTDKSMRLAHWQAALLAALAIIFLLTTLFSQSPIDTLRGLPNLVVYWLLLFSLMVLVRSRKDLWRVTCLILILAFILSLWRVELRPLRILVGLPSLGINGAVFAFHPAVAIALIVALMLPRNTASHSWRVFAWLALFSLVFHGLLFQTRAGWLAWSVILIPIGVQLRGRTRIAFAFAMAGIALMGIFLFSEVILHNLDQTRATAQAAVGEIPYAEASSDDVIRLVARDAGLRMLQARPILGWGSNSYFRLKPTFMTYIGKEADLAGAFNSWLIALADWGIIGTTVVLIVFLLSFPLAWRAIQVERTPETILAFGFSLGVLALSIHLLFIDLMYSFAWAHAGIALAASRLAVDSVDTNQ